MKPLVLAGVLIVGLAAPGPATAAPTSKTDNLALVATFANQVSDLSVMQRGGTDMAFDGRYVYAAEQGAKGGVHIIDTAPTRPRRVGFLPCGGIQNDVSVLRPGLLALGYHNREFSCGNPQGGITLVDVSTPARPRLLGSTTAEIPAGNDPTADGVSGLHTMTVLPGTPYIYASPGGRQMASKSIQTIVDVSDPRRPKVAASFDTGIGCHDVAFDIRPERRLGFCTGPGATQVWDVEDPLAPKVIGHIVNPLHSFHHSAAVTPDGKYVVIGTETVANDCVGGPSGGGLFIYDITRPEAPRVAGHFGAQRGAENVYTYPTDLTFDELCAPHLFNFIPSTRTLVSGNGSGGLNVIDWTEPARPREIAHYQPADRDYFAAYWFGGRIYANGVQALDVLAAHLDRPAATPRVSPATQQLTPLPQAPRLLGAVPRYLCALPMRASSTRPTRR
ncbi:MAG TPA: hypothetical protein VNB94_05190 [Mycobacteriales bacterium]|nr:hypothetical protein [Mycobacteriales bacterium]